MESPPFGIYSGSIWSIFSSALYPLYCYASKKSQESCRKLWCSHSRFHFLNSIDEDEVIEISNNEIESEDNDELAITPPHSPRSRGRIGLPSTPSPIKSSFVLFYLAIFIFIFYTK